MINRRQFLVAAGAVGIATGVSLELLRVAEAKPTVRNMQQMVRPRTGFLALEAWHSYGAEEESRIGHWAIARGGERKNMLMLHSFNAYGGSCMWASGPSGPIIITREHPVAFGANFDGAAYVTLRDDRHRIFSLQMALSRHGGAMATELVPAKASDTNDIELGYHPTPQGLLTNG